MSKTIKATKINHKIIAIQAPVAIQAAEEGKKIPSFSVQAYTGGALRVNGYSEPVVVDLAGMSFGTSLVANLDHDSTKRVGHVTQKSKDGGKLQLGGLASAATAARDEVVNSAADGFVWQASIEALPTKLVEVPSGKSITVNGQKFDGPVIVAKKSTLQGFAFVSHGADDKTTVSIAATGDTKERETVDPKFQKWIEAMGFEVDSLTAEQIKALQANYDGRNAPKPAVLETTGDDSYEAIVATQRKERERVKTIGGLVSAALSDYPQHDEAIERLGRLALDGGWDKDQFELELLRATRPQAHTVGGSMRGERANGLVIEAALCKAAKLANYEEQFNERTLEAADRQFRSGLGLQELLLMAAHENGHRSFRVTQGNVRQVLTAAFAPIRAGGFTSISLPNILSNVANKILLDAFNFVDSSWRKLAAVRNVSNLQAVTSHVLTGDLKYEEVGPTGQIKHGTLGEETYTNQARTYAKMLALTRTHILNDDMGAFNALPKKLGRGGAQKIKEIFWRTFLDNATFYTALRGNFDDGADSAFDAAGLEAADRLFRSQTDPDGEILGAIPKLLVVPPTKKIAAQRLMKSQHVHEDSVAGDENPWAGAFEIVSSAEMESSAYTGNSTKKWYLLADPNDLPVVEMCFLNGVETPVIESTDADFDTLGIQIRAFHDVGAALQEYRGGVAMKGEN